jgi:FMN phosphatase YigB (HAD superfamily)
LWGQQKQGKLTVAQVIQKRANGIATEMEKPDIGSKFEVTFGDELGKSTEPIEGVGKALEYVYRKGYNLFCASNGIKTMQINRMQEAGLLN